MITYSVFLTDCEDPESIASRVGPKTVLDIIENQPSRYSVQKWEEETDDWEYNLDDELLETLNGEEWLDKYTLTVQKRVLI